MKLKTSFLQKLFLVSFGILCCVFLIEISLRFAGLVFSSLQQYRNYLSIKQKGTYRILCLGESTTTSQYPSLLERALNQHNIGIKFSVIDKGIIGTNTSCILSRLVSNIEEYHPDIVITMMGINDWGSHMPYVAVSDSNAINFFRSFRIYKLTRLFWLHIITFLVQKSELGQGYVEKEAIGLDPNKDLAYVEQGRLSEAEALLKKAIERNPKSDTAHFELGWIYRRQGRFSEAETLLKKAIELNPKNDIACVELGWFYRSQGRFSEAETLLKKAIELNPKNDMAYVEQGWFYGNQGRFSEAETLLKKAIELNPKNDMAYFRLVSLYRRQGWLSDIEALLKKAIELNPKNDTKYRAALKELYVEMGNSRLAREYDRKATESELNYYSQMTIGNYHKLKAILDKRGIVYVCVQYPMRNLEHLKKIFQGNAEGIIFVDNENIFKVALNKSGYKEYFTDMFGGDFGHCTKKGNRLLAENIANVIIKEVFGR